jgi:hypothetical protein
VVACNYPAVVMGAISGLCSYYSPVSNVSRRGSAHYWLLMVGFSNKILRD